MKTTKYIDATVVWARALLASLARRAAASAAPPAGAALSPTALVPPPEGDAPETAELAELSAAVDRAAAADEALAELDRRFGIEPAERRVLDLALAIDRSPIAARAARALSGARGLTVQLVEEALGDGEAVMGWLAPRARLRAHGLLIVSGIPGAPAAPTADVTLAPGLAARLTGHLHPSDPLGAGVEWIPPSLEGTIVSDEVNQLVRDEALGPRWRWVSIGGAQPGEALAIALGLARRLRRPTLLVDGRSLAGVNAALTWALLVAARREADLHDAPVVVDEAFALGGAWRALAARPPSGATLPSTIVLVDAAQPARGRPDAGFVLHQVVLATATPAPPAPPVAPPQVAPPPADDGFEAVRRQAAMDVARAMGKPFHLPPDRPPPKTISRSSAASPIGAAVTAPSLPAIASPGAAPPASIGSLTTTSAADLPTTVPALPATTAAASFAAGADPHPTPAGAPCAAPEPPAGARFGGDAGRHASAPPSGPRASVERPGAPLPTDAAEAAPPEPASGSPSVFPDALAPDGPPPPDPAESLPFLPVADDATIADLIQLTYQTPNPLQRAQLLQRLGGEPKDVRIVTVLRGYTKAEHPLVRATAEAGMARLFGAGWNQARVIPKPVQPPRGDEPDRGPPGGFR